MKLDVILEEIIISHHSNINDPLIRKNMLIFARICDIPAIQMSTFLSKSEEVPCKYVKLVNFDFPQTFAKVLGRLKEEDEDHER